MAERMVVTSFMAARRRLLEVPGIPAALGRSPESSLSTAPRRPEPFLYYGPRNECKEDSPGTPRRGMEMIGPDGTSDVGNPWHRPRRRGQSPGRRIALAYVAEVDLSAPPIPPTY